MITSQELLASIAETYRLRYLERNRRYVGIHDGICLDVAEADDVLVIYAFAPAAFIGEQILEDFRGFTTVAELEVPTSWLQGRVLKNKDVDEHGCLVELTPGRLQSLSPEQVLAIPQALANDFKTFGSQPIPAPCSFCGTAEGRLTLMSLGEEYRIACFDCLDDLREQAPQGHLSEQPPVSWGHAIPTLILGTVLLAIVWGWVQQPPHQLNSTMIFLGPFLGAVGLCKAAGTAAGGTSILLRIATCVATLIAILAGNIWGFHTMLRHQFQIHNPLLVSAEGYFTFWWPENPGPESAYVIGGLAGAWLGWGMLKSTGLLKYE